MYYHSSTCVVQVHNLVIPAIHVLPSVYWLSVRESFCESIESAYLLVVKGMVVMGMVMMGMVMMMTVMMMIMIVMMSVMMMIMM